MQCYTGYGKGCYQELGDDLPNRGKGWNCQIVFEVLPALKNVISQLRIVDIVANILDGDECSALCIASRIIIAVNLPQKQPIGLNSLNFDVRASARQYPWQQHTHTHTHTHAHQYGTVSGKQHNARTLPPNKCARAPVETIVRAIGRKADAANMGWP